MALKTVERHRTPARQAGRIDDKNWELIKRAAKKLGIPHTHFIRETAIKRAGRVLGVQVEMPDYIGDQLRAQANRGV